VRAEKSAIPANGDRGLSGSAMLRSYSQTQRTTRAASVGIYPYGPGRPAMCSVGRSPVGGGDVGHWKWRNASFPRGYWKSFPTDLLEMEEVQDSRHFHISRAICTDTAASKPVVWCTAPWLELEVDEWPLHERHGGKR
jgi:hypothetical protein